MIALKVLLTATIIPGILDFNPTSILQGTLSAVLPHYQSASYAFTPLLLFKQFTFTTHVTTVTFCRYIFTDSLYRFT